MVIASARTEAVPAGRADGILPGRGPGGPSGGDPARPREVGRAGRRRLERQCGVIAAVFGLLFSLQTYDALVAGWPSMPGAPGVVLVALVALSLVLALVAAALPGRAIRLFGAAVGVHVLALAVWPFAVHGVVPSAPMPWFAGLWPAQALFLAMATRRPVLPLLASAAVASYVVVVLVARGGQDLEDAAASGLFALVVAGLLVALLCIIRRGVRRAELAQRTALDRFGRSRLDDATEIERTRTDALVQDSVLTTLLSAASARSDEQELLAARMAANAVRVLAHVTRSAERGPVIAFGRAMAEADARLAPLLQRFAVTGSCVEQLVVPVQVAETLIDALVDAMEDSVRHAAAVRTLSLAPLGPDGIRIVVQDDRGPSDRGAGLAPGPEVAVIERLRHVDGRAVFDSAPGRGTAVTLSWGSVVVSGTQPLEQEEVVR